MRLPASVVAAILLGASMPVGSPLSGQVEPGGLIRIQLDYNPTGQKYLRGTYGSVSNDSLWLIVDNPNEIAAQRMAIALSRIATIDVHSGVRKATWTGGKWGAIGGFFAGTVVGAFVLHQPRECALVERPGVPGQTIVDRVCTAEGVSVPEGAVYGGGLGLGVGAVLGLVVGSLFDQDLWQAIGVERIAAGVAPTGWELGVRWLWP